MFPVLGILVVLGAVVGGYLMEKGHLVVLMQPAELVIIGGAAVGTLLIANPPQVVAQIFRGLLRSFQSSPYNKDFYLENLQMLFAFFAQARKEGINKLEADIEAPDKSPLFQKFPKFLHNHHALHFVCDTMRMAIGGGVATFDLEQMMELDLEVHHHEVHEPVAALTTVADALPGLGIVAAVLGVVITMGALGGPAEEVGHKVAAALVGTFLGILLCYGFFGPLASAMSKRNEAESHYYHCLRVALIAFIKGSAPILSVEFGRRAIPSVVRPSFQEMEKLCKGGTA